MKRMTPVKEESVASRVMLFSTDDLDEDGFYLIYKKIKLKNTRNKRHYFRKPKGFDPHLVCKAYPNCEDWPAGCSAGGDYYDDF